MGIFGFIRKRRSTGSDPGDPGEAGAIYRFSGPIKRSWLASRWEGREAVLGKVSLQDFLQFRLREYLSQSPQNRHPLPFKIIIADGKIVQTSNPDAEAHPWRAILEESSGEDSFEVVTVRGLRFLSHSETASVLKDLQEYQGDFSKLSERKEEVTEDLEDQATDRNYEIAAGEFPTPATLDRSTEHRGRPPLSSRWIPWVGYLAIAAIILVEAWQFALPYLNTIGIDVANLPGEWNRSPIGILAGGGFALAASALIFVLWYWIFQSCLSIFKDSGSEPWWRTAAKVALPSFLLVFLIATVWGIGAMRHGASKGANNLMKTLHNQGPATSGGEGTFILLTILVPLATAFLQHMIGEFVEKRRKIEEDQRKWDQVEHQALLVKEQRQEIIHLLEEKKRRIEEEREEVRDKIRALAERCQQAESLVRNRIDTERAFAIAFMNSLLAALEQDRYYFIQEAGKKGATDLINPRSSGLAVLQKESLPSYQESVAGLHQAQGGRGNGQF